MEDNTILFKVKFSSFLNNYEFYGYDILDNKHARSYENKMYDIYKYLYFEMSNDFKYCQDIISGKIFTQEENSKIIGNYYNKETGLVLLIPIVNLYSDVNLKDLTLKAFDKKYVKSVLKFYYNYEQLQKRDEDLVAKKHLLSLK